MNLFSPKICSGNRNIGVNVKVMWAMAEYIISLFCQFRIRQIPINDSNKAKAIKPKYDGRKPNVRIWIVLVANSSAGLAPGKNFKTPKIK